MNLAESLWCDCTSLITLNRGFGRRRCGILIQSVTVLQFGIVFSHCKAGYGLSCSIQRDVGHLALLFVGQDGVAEGFLFGVLGKEAGEGVGADVADFYVNAN